MKNIEINNFLNESSSNSRNKENKLKSLKDCSSEQEHKANALASGAEEGRDKLR